MEEITEEMETLAYQEAGDELSKKPECFPRCEYKARFDGTTEFEMSDPRFYGTYFRTTSTGGNCDRLATSLKKKGYENSFTNTAAKGKKHISSAKAGTLYSPWKHEEYDIFSENPKSPERGFEKDSLYDFLLEYKLSICSLLVEKLKEEMEMNEISQIFEVFFGNDYPCIMVQVKSLNALVKNEQNSMYKIFVAYFIAITNFEAKKNNVPIEMVHRSSFGHNFPSTVATGTSFRINIGIVPKIYVTKVLVESLKILNNEFLVPLLKEDFKLDLDPEDVTRLKKQAQSYMESKSDKAKKKAKPKSMLQMKNLIAKSTCFTWNIGEPLISILCKSGDSRGGKITYQIMRKKQYVDELIDLVHLNLISAENDFSKPLKLFLRRINYYLVGNEWKVTMYNMYFEENKAKLQHFNRAEHAAIKEDVEYWKILRRLSLKFKLSSIDDLSKVIGEKKIYGLNKALEKCNLKFVQNSSYINDAENGYGSDSECEIEIEGKKIYAKKIVLATGMRAITYARYLSTCVTHSQKVDTRFMYFETAEAIQQTRVNSVLQKTLFPKLKPDSQHAVKYIDLTHCATDFVNPKKASIVDINQIQNEITDTEQVLVLDYTSARSDRIFEAIKVCLKKAPILILINSGLKNEQCGADMNPYGTLRIFAEDKNVLTKLYFTLLVCLKGEELPKQTHQIRKAYKDAGAVLGIERLFKRVDVKLRMVPRTELNNDEELTLVQKFRIISEGGPFENELNNLIYVHKQNLEEIVHWTVDRIKFLGSVDVMRIVDFVDGEFVDGFSQINKKYSKNAVQTEYIINDVCYLDNFEIGVVFNNKDFNQFYKQFLIEEKKYKEDEWNELNDLAQGKISRIILESDLDELPNSYEEMNDDESQEDDEDDGSYLDESMQISEEENISSDDDGYLRLT